MDEHASDRTQRTIAVGLMVAIVGVAVAGMLWMTLGGGAAWLVGHVRDVETQVATNPAVALATFGVVVFLIQLVSLPGGTVAVLSGGYLFGAPLAAGVYYLSQVAAAPFVYQAVRLGIGPGSDRLMTGLAHPRLPATLSAWMSRARDEAVLAIIVFRLAPVLTSTFVPALAAILGLPLRAVVLGSLLVSWIKPSITASIGATARSLAEATDPNLMLSQIGVAPFLMIFLAAIGLLALRIVFAWRR